MPEIDVFLNETMGIGMEVLEHREKDDITP